jgi:hypothetical protein
MVKKTLAITTTARVAPICQGLMPTGGALVWGRTTPAAISTGPCLRAFFCSSNFLKASRMELIDPFSPWHYLQTEHDTLYGLII